MYARVTTFKFEPARAGEVAAKFKEMAPAARTLPGAVNVYAAWRADGQGSVTAIYKSKADADAAAARDPGTLGRPNRPDQGRAQHGSLRFRGAHGGLAVNLQEAVHSVRTGSADVAKHQ